LSFADECTKSGLICRNMTIHDILEKLESLGNPEDAEGMVRFGITPEKTFGVRIPDLRKLAKEIGRDQNFSLKLWEVDTRETRILAAMTGEPDKVTAKQMDDWAAAFDYWEICDQCCMNLFEKTPFAYDKAIEYSSRPEEFIKRTGFVLMARLAVSDKKAADSDFTQFFSFIRNGSDDNRVMVKKSSQLGAAANWETESESK